MRRTESKNSRKESVIDCKKIVSFFSLDEKPFQNQGAFWVCIFLMLLVILFTVYSVSDYKISVSPSGVRNFIAMTKGHVPLIGLAVAVFALVARMHSTVQTHRQIEIAKSNSLFKNYLDHRKYIYDFVGDLNVTFKKLDFDAARLYKLFFPENNYKKFNGTSHARFGHDHVVKKIGDDLNAVMLCGMLDCFSEGESWPFSEASFFKQLSGRLAVYGIKVSQDHDVVFYYAFFNGEPSGNIVGTASLNLMSQIEEVFNEISYIFDSPFPSGLKKIVLFLNIIRSCEGMVDEEILRQWDENFEENSFYIGAVENAEKGERNE